MKIVYVIVYVLVNLIYVTNITCICSVINIFTFYVIMYLFKNIHVCSLDSIMGDPLILNDLNEMLRNEQGKYITMMLQEISLKIVFYRFNYLMFPTILC